MKEFLPNFPADVKYVVLDMLSEQENSEDIAVTTTEVHKRLESAFETALSRSLVNDILCHLCTEGVIAQGDMDSAEYVWIPVKEEKKPKKATPKEEKTKKTEKEEAKQSSDKAPQKKLKFATKKVVDTDRGQIVFYTVQPDKFNADEFKGWWIGTSDEALEVYLFSKELKQNEVKSLMMQLVNCDKGSVKIKKNF